MRKISFYLVLTFIIMSCDNKEDLPAKNQSTKYPQQLYIINGDLEYWSDITDGSKPKEPIFIYNTPEKIEEDTIQKTTSKTSEQSVSLNFAYGIYDPTNSGCTIKKYNGNKEYYTDAGVYGPNPYPQANGYLVRGYGRAHQNLYYGSLVLFVDNKVKKTNTRRGIVDGNDESGSAISIEYPFKPNITYEISIKATFYDNRYLVDKVFSSGFPTVFVQLKNDGIITLPNIRNYNQDFCDGKGIISLEAENYVNYTRSYKLESQGAIQRTLVFKFSPTEEKKALLISVHPAKGEAGYGTIPINNYTMVMPLVKITEKPFDPALNVELPNDGRR
ncbi:hypothetical protein [Flavobacterium sp. N1736]|uniref:hypothetical protein n=1 Tax=Flavobacterium sp. N1736 TaxID=2986823 RepID=UPI0022250DA8|nr:hypothetical protein [Flavobacterium sp. N1736]